MDILKISGILEEQQKLLETQTNSTRESLNELVDTLFANADNIKNIEILNEAKEQTLDNVLDDLTFLISKFEKFGITHKQFLKDNNVIFNPYGPKSTKGSALEATAAFKELGKDFRTLTQNLKDKLPADSVITPTVDQGAGSTETGKSKTVNRKISITLDDGQVVDLNLQSASPIIVKGKSVHVDTNKLKLTSIDIDGTNTKVQKVKGS